MAVVTLTTDFGLEDAYVGQVKGAILSVCPGASLVDLTHAIPPQDVRRAAVIVARSAGHFPAGTVHLAVVDPGVGTRRRALAVRSGEQLFVAPDNGLLTLVLQADTRAKVRLLNNPGFLSPTISPTFHGRDVFAPAAGHLACGLPLNRLGPRVDDPVLLELARPAWSRGRLKGEVLFVDHFGNLITNLPADKILDAPRSGSPRFKLGQKTLPGLHLTYAEVDEGLPLALIGSLDLVEIAVNQGRADEYFGVREGAAVEAVWE